MFPILVEYSIEYATEEGVGFTYTLRSVLVTLVLL